MKREPVSEEYNVATDGIDITPVKIDQIEFDCWDFGGDLCHVLVTV